MAGLTFAAAPVKVATGAADVGFTEETTTGVEATGVEATGVGTTLVVH